MLGHLRYLSDVIGLANFIRFGCFRRFTESHERRSFDVAAVPSFDVSDSQNFVCSHDNEEGGQGKGEFEGQSQLIKMWMRMFLLV